MSVPPAVSPLLGCARPLRTGAVAAAGGLLGLHVPASGLLALAVVAGLPHGAFDYDVAKRQFGSSPRWRALFFGGYLGLVAASLALWWCAAPVALGGFFLLSVIHFGAEDAPSGAARPWRVVAHGGAPIILPALLHPAEFTRIVAILIGHHAEIMQRVVAGPMAIAWVIAFAATLGVYARDTRATSRNAALDLLLVGALFGVAPPLVAFASYFALIHTPRAFASLRQTRSANSGASWRAATTTVLALALAGAVFLADSSWTASENIVRTSFILLSALTVPHMALGYLGRLAPKGFVGRGLEGYAKRPRAIIPQ